MCCGIDGGRAWGSGEGELTADDEEGGEGEGRHDLGLGWEGISRRSTYSREEDVLWTKRVCCVELGWVSILQFRACRWMPI